MILTDKNIVYTFVPTENSWKYDKDFYLIDFYCLCLSAHLVRKNLNVKSIKLYTIPEIIDFFKDTNYFDELIDINTIESLKKIDWNKNRYNTLYKLFVTSIQKEPFIHIDHDLFIMNPNVFDVVETEHIFGFKERFNVPFYQFYVDNIIQIEGVTPNVNDYAINCCLYGSNTNKLSVSFQKSVDLLIEKYDEFIFIDKIDCYIEQYFQVKELLKLTEEKDIFLFENDIKRVFDDNVIFGDYGMVHLSGNRYGDSFKKEIVATLKRLDNSMDNRIKINFGCFKWN